MKKKLCLILSVIMVVCMAVACGSSQSAASSDEPITLKLSELNSEQTSQYRYDMKFAELVAEKTDGAVNIEVYANGSLSSQDCEAVTTGICDILMCIPSNWSDYYGEIAAIDAPYSITSAAEGIAVMADTESPVIAKVNEELADDNVVWLGGYYEGAREMTTTNTEIYTLDDLKSLKMRVPNSDIFIELFESFGCEATPMDWSQVASGLVTGVIDGQENPITGYKEDSLQEIQKYVILTHHLPANYGLWMNKGVYDKLTAEQQAAVMEAGCEAAAWMSQDREDALAECRAELEADGMVFIGEEEGLDLKSFEEAAMKVYDKHPEWGELVDIIAETRGR